MIPIYVPIIVLVTISIDQTISRQKNIKTIIGVCFVLLLGFHLTSSTRDALAFGKDGRHWSDKGFQELPIHKFVKSLPPRSLLMSNHPQQLFSVSKRPPVFNQYQIDAAKNKRCSHRYFVWYNSLYDDGTPNLEGVPTGAVTMFADNWGTVFDLGTCSDDINYFWP
jgi:hypothetical protein